MGELRRDQNAKKWTIITDDGNQLRAACCQTIANDIYSECRQLTNLLTLQIA
jgi:hypothetical protein